MSLKNNLTTKQKIGTGAGITAVIIASIFSLEGGYTNDPKDPGGETNFGITANTAKANGYTKSIKDMTKEEAFNIYETSYINKPKYNLILKSSPTIGHKLIDAGVNVGTYRSSTWFQIALNSFNRDGKDYPMITIDGVIGSKTNSAFVALQSKRGIIKACELILKSMDAQQTMHYLSLTNLRVFTVGWIDNRVGNIPLSKCKEDTHG